MKLEYLYTSIYILNSETMDSWKVEFTGVHTVLTARLFKNKVFVIAFDLDSGHANKTAAIRLVKKAIEYYKK